MTYLESFLLSFKGYIVKLFRLFVQVMYYVYFRCTKNANT